MSHKPVLLEEVIEILNPQPGETYIDATVGEGGHSQEILKRIAPHGTLLAVDWDKKALATAQKNFSRFKEKNRILLEVGNYVDICKLVGKNKIRQANGILFDLGFGSHTLENLGRGFSFQKDEPLDMRYNPEAISVTAGEIVNRWSREDLEKIFMEYGEERFSHRIAAQIIEQRRKKKITTIRQLVEIILSSVPRRGKIHPATRVFQALRIAVNNELDNLQKGLAGAVEILSPGGKIAVISFHSLEDRIVKNFFKEKQKENQLKILTKKPIRPSQEEIIRNPRARSACLRVATK